MGVCGPEDPGISGAEISRTSCKAGILVFPMRPLGHCLISQWNSAKRGAEDLFWRMQKKDLGRSHHILRCGCVQQ